MKRIGFGIVILVIVGAACVALAEIALRLTADQELRSQLQMAQLMRWESGKGLVLKPDADLGITLPSGEAAFRVRTDHQGRRLNGQTPPPGGPLILALGDSQTFGFGVADEQTWPASLERILGRRVLNAGFRSGFCPPVQAAYLRDFGLAEKPAVVLLAFTVANDLLDMKALVSTGRDAHGLPETVESPRGWLQPLVGATAIYQFFGRRFLNYRLRRATTAALRRAKPENGQAPFPFDVEWTEAADILRGMDELCRGRGAQFGVVLLPHRAPQTNPTHQEISRRMLALAADSGLALLDLEPHLLADADPARFFFPIDGHFTPQGTRVMADATARFVRGQFTNAATAP